MATSESSVVAVATAGGVDTPDEESLAALRKIRPPTSPSRFVQGWSPETHRLWFGCGDGTNGVIVYSDGGLRIAKSGCIRTRLDSRTVDQFRSDPPQVEDPFGRVEAILTTHVHFDDPRLYGLVALWIIGTYVHSIFSHYGYLFFHSVLPRSGKTRLLELLNHLAFEASPPLNAPTPAAIRESAANGGTLLLDTLERWRDKSTESYSAAMELLDAGFRNGGVAAKMVQSADGQWKKKEFQIFAPYAMAGIRRESLSDTALDRAFVVEMHRKSISVKKHKYSYDTCEVQCEPLRGDLYLWALRNAGRVAAIYQDHALEDELDALALNDRAADIWHPILSIARTLEVEPQVWERLISLAKEMGGDPEALEDERQLAVVRALRKATEHGRLVATTSDLSAQLRALGIVGINLHALLTEFGFRQKSVRLKKGPRRAWELTNSRLAQLEQELRSGSRVEPIDGSPDLVEPEQSDWEGERPLYPGQTRLQ